MNPNAVDFDQLGRLWRSQATPGCRTIQRLARRARRRAEFQRWFDYAMTALCLSGIIPIAFSRYNPLLIAGGLLFTFLCLWPAWRRHRIAQLTADLGHDEQAVLRRLSRIADLEVAYRRFCTWSFIPIVPLARLLVLLSRVDGDVHRLPEVIHPLGELVRLAVIVGVGLWCIRGLRRSKRERDQLRTLAAEYRVEERALRELEPVHA